MMSEVVKINKK